MKFKPSNINTFLLFKLPSAYFTGVRVKSLSPQNCSTTVKHRWINKNPFNSIFWAVQGMAAELSTGALVMMKIKQSKNKISMLVASNKGNFFKKAKGRITYICNDGEKIDAAVAKAIATHEGQIVIMKSEGRDSGGAIVSVFEFEWTLKIKKTA